jgi:hypothetical protein
MAFPVHNGPPFITRRIDNFADDEHLVWNDLPGQKRLNHNYNMILSERQVFFGKIIILKHENALFTGEAFPPLLFFVNPAV